MKTFTNTQVDRLGDRLRGRDIAESDLQLLDAYRLSFTPAYEGVVEALRDQLKLSPTGRPAKSTTSISDKLRRESIRLSQMQDIAGCRVIVDGIAAQDNTARRLSEIFNLTSTFDRRDAPSHGYRAVHVIVRHLGMPVEVQIRTALEHIWAEFSEKLSDIVDPSVKYGGGPEELRAMLLDASETVGEIESLEQRLLRLEARPGLHELPDIRESVAQLAGEFAENKQRVVAHLEKMVAQAHLWKDE